MSSRSMVSNLVDKSSMQSKKVEAENTSTAQVTLKSAFNNLQAEPTHSQANYIPEAMPLIRKISLLNSKEPEFQKYRRGTATYHS